MDSETDLNISTRPQRTQKMSLRAMESLYIQKLRSSRISKEDVNSFSSGDDDEDYECLDAMEKPTVLLSSNTVDGGKIFSFQKRKTKRLLAQKVYETKEQMAKTPRRIRNVIKKRIAAAGSESLVDLDFSDSGSEYEPSRSSESGSTESESSEESESSSSAAEKKKPQRFAFPKRKGAYIKNVNKENTESSEESDSSSSASNSRANVKSKKMQPKATKFTFPVKRSSRRKNTAKKYIIKTDDYFTNHASKKVITSNHTLDKLKTPRLPHDELRSILQKMKLSKEHKRCVNELCLTSKSHFDKWLLLMQENFNILLYGLGSKRSVLEEFHDKCLKDLPVIVVNGFFPTVTIKDVLDAVIIDLLELKENPANVYEACNLIEQEFSYIPDTHLYLIVHNIEGDMLRNKKAQDVLSKLASIRNIHLIASMDHINGPLIWDHSKLSKYNFSWWDVTSLLPYIEETSFESSMFIQSGGTLALSSLNNVFLSLTPNSRGIYLIIVKHHLDNAKHQYYQGIAFKDLYWSCREAFLVSSDLALRAQLNEFVDHKMVKFKRSADGTEFLTIPISNAILKKFLEEQNELSVT